MLNADVAFPATVGAPRRQLQAFFSGHGGVIPGGGPPDTRPHGGPRENWRGSHFPGSVLVV